MQKSPYTEKATSVTDDFWSSQQALKIEQKLWLDIVYSMTPSTIERAQYRNTLKNP